MGIKYIHLGKRIEYQLAFFKNAEELRFGNDSEISHSRYSYDVAGRNKEINQFNGKLIFKIGEEVLHRFGTSAAFGSLYNLDTKNKGDHYKLVVHYEASYRKWNLKGEAMMVDHDPANPRGVSGDLILMAAYGAPYEVAADFNMYTLTIARSVPVDWGPVSALLFYNDFGYMKKEEDDFADSAMNVLGVLVTAGPFYTYIDYAAGWNHSWLGGNYIDDFSSGTAGAKWEARFNINIGYYF